MTAVVEHAPIHGKNQNTITEFKDVELEQDDTM
jgi:hypothetical protein